MSLWGRYWGTVVDGRPCRCGTGQRGWGGLGLWGWGGDWGWGEVESMGRCWGWGAVGAGGENGGWGCGVGLWGDIGVGVQWGELWGGMGAGVGVGLWGGYWGWGTVVAGSPCGSGALHRGWRGIGAVGPGLELGAGVRLRLWGDIGVGVQWGGAGGGIGGWGEIESMGRYWGWGCSGGCKPI